MNHALTVDVEEWYHVCGVTADGGEPHPRRARQNIEKLLTLLADRGVKGTFFVLGSLAAEEPTLVPMIAAAGHEIASHGYSHRLVPELGPQLFRDEIRRTGELLERQAGQRPVGFRAPQWSLSLSATPWAFDILREEGYRYDSSLTPLPFIGERRGPRFPFTVQTAAGSLLEIPPLVTPSPLGNLPTGGGWGFRLFPLAAIIGTIGKMSKDGAPAVLFVHPRELDPAGPRLRLGALRAFAAYGTRTDATQRLSYLLRRFSFAPLRDMVEKWESA